MTARRCGLVLVASVAAAAGPIASGLAPNVPAAAQTESLTVFAAADLAPPFRQIVPEFERTAKTAITLALGSTGMLTQQIRNGAPADVFFAANESFVKELAGEGLTIEHSTTLYARGRLATVTLASSGFRVNSLGDLGNPAIRRIAIANPQHAPYGLAARQALERAGLWRGVESRLVFGENVQQAAQFVRSGAAEAGIVARSVAETDLSWTLVDDGLHAPLNQVAVILRRTKLPAESRAFIDFVNGIQGRGVLRQFGFLLPGEF
jgi:molybdate transport system substrate-binding protein